MPFGNPTSLTRISRFSLVALRPRLLTGLPFSWPSPGPKLQRERYVNTVPDCYDQMRRKVTNI